MALIDSFDVIAAKETDVQYIGGFEMFLFPRYVGPTGKDASAENVFRQTAFWDALHIVVVSEQRFGVELRFVANESDRSISTYIFLFTSLSKRESSGSETESFVQKVVDRVARLLPKDCAFREMGSNEVYACVTQTSRTKTNWAVANISRRAQYVDLPSVLSDTTGDDRPDAQPKTNGDFSGLFSQLKKASNDSLTRQFPDELALEDDLSFKRFCLPLVGDIQEYVGDRRQLYEEMQACAPAVISIAMHPYSPEALEEDRQIATRFSAFLSVLGRALANSGFLQPGSLQRVYDRYFLTNKHICVATIRVAASTDGDALAVGNQICSWLGGMKSFQVITREKRIPNIGTNLCDPRNAFPPQVEDEAWEDELETLKKDLITEKVDPPEEARLNRFLIRLPHIYTVDELSKLLRIPYGEEKGLPGLATRMLPPFYATSQRYDPVANIEHGNLSYREPSSESIRIGRVNPSSSMPSYAASDEKLHWHSIPATDLAKHTLIVGSTGSGKTITTLFLMRELVRLDIPFLVIEPVKTEYYGALKSIPGLDNGALRRYRFEGNEKGERGDGFLAFDPMRLQKGVTVARHVSYLKSCFEAAFPLEAWQSLLLENGLLAYYLARADDKEKGCGFKLFTRGGPGVMRIAKDDKDEKNPEAELFYPSFETFKRFLLGPFLERELGVDKAKSASSERLEEMRQIFRRRFENLSEGPLGAAFRVADNHAIKSRGNGGWYSHFEYLLTRPTIIELDAIVDPEQKSLIMAFLMTFLYERRQADDLLDREDVDGSQSPVSKDRWNGQKGVRHIVVVEEAHRLLANPDSGSRGQSVGSDSRRKAVSLFVDMLAEIRAFQQGLVIVEQIPTKLVPAAVKNTNLKIMLRLTSRDDRDYLGEAMSFNEEQKQFVSFLRAERGLQVNYVAFDENTDQPVLLTLPLRDKSDSNSHTAWLFDEYFDKGAKPEKSEP